MTESAQHSDQRPRRDPDKRRDVARIVTIAAVGVTLMVVVWWLFLRLRSFLLLLFVALFVSLAVEPPVSWLARRGWRRGLATSLVFVVLIILGLAFMGSMGAVVATQARGMVDAIPQFVQDATRFSNEHFHTNLTPHDIFGRLSGQGGPLRSFTGRALRYGATAFGLLFDTLTIGLFAWFFAADGPRLRRFICSLMPPAKQRAVLRAWTLAIDRTAGYLYSRGLLAVASALAHGVFFTLIGLPYGAALGVWVGVVSQFIPTIGTYLAGILPVVVALGTDPIKALWVVLSVAIYQAIENYAFMPKLTQFTLSIHPAVAFGGVIVGAAILGPVGALLALPAAASIQAFASAYVRSYEVVDEPLIEDHKAAHRS
jgi:predicted PurR-regulated permease PerM